jgi:hypothetical protein
MISPNTWGMWMLIFVAWAEMTGKCLMQTSLFRLPEKWTTQNPSMKIVTGKARCFWQFRGGEFCYDIQISLTGGGEIRTHVFDQENLKFMGTNPSDTECAGPPCGSIKCKHICPLWWLLTALAGCVGNRIRQHGHMEEVHGRCMKVLIWPRCRK